MSDRSYPPSDERRAPIRRCAALGVVFWWIDDVLTAREAGEIDAGAPVCLSQSVTARRVLRVCAYPASTTVAAARAPLAGLRLSWKEQRRKKDGDDDAAIWFWREVDAGWGIGEGGSDAGILPLDGRWW